MQVIYAGETPPPSFEASIFLAGPTPRAELGGGPSWRPRALEFLEERDFNGVVFVPEPREGCPWPGYQAQVEWEAMALNMSDRIVFWIPRNMRTMPGLTTNDEFGWWRARDPMRVILGTPLQTEAENIRYQHVKAMAEDVPDAWTIEETLMLALDALKSATTERSGGERSVPLHIWRTGSFQAWLKSQKAAGNRLDDARVEWVFRVGEKRTFPFFWALWVSVWIESEGRHKTNEVVLARPDISCIVATAPPVLGRRTPEDAFRFTRVALITEFRSPANNELGKVLELPGGSTFKGGVDPLSLAAAEFKEETGLVISPDRFRHIQTRQMVATLSAHRAHAFAVTLTAAEMDQLHSMETARVVLGVEEDTERTTVSVRTVEQLLQSGVMDWSMMGMLLTTLLI